MRPTSAIQAGTVALLAGLAVVTASSRPPTLATPSPTTVTVTAYDGLGARLTLTLHDRAGIGRLADDLRHLTAVEAPQTFGCPPDDGSHFVAVFDYTDHRRLTADIQRTGCGHASIAGLGSSGSWSNPQFLSDLEALFPPSWQTNFGP